MSVFLVLHHLQNWEEINPEVATLVCLCMCCRIIYKLGFCTYAVIAIFVSVSSFSWSGLMNPADPQTFQVSVKLLWVSFPLKAFMFDKCHMCCMFFCLPVSSFQCQTVHHVLLAIVICAKQQTMCNWLLLSVTNIRPCVVGYCYLWQTADHV